MADCRLRVPIWFRDATGKHLIGSGEWPSPGARAARGFTFMMAASSLISELRGSLSDESARIQREFEASGDGRAAVAQRTRLVEDILARLWRDIVSPDPVQARQFCAGRHRRIRAGMAVSLFRYRSAFSLRRSRAPSRLSKIRFAAFRRNCGTCG